MINENIIELNYKPHDKQKLFHNSEARWRILDCGRRWGKTQCAIAEGIRLSLKKPKQRGWIVAPTYPLSQEDWRTLKEITPQKLIINEFKAERKFVFINKSEIDFRSADNESAMRGAGLDFVILDEAARIKEDSWNALRPALSDKRGKGIFISTPKGKNWFYRLYLLGKQKKEEYESWHFPANTNPYFPEDEWIEAKNNYPADWFSQEYEAEFLDDIAAVFRKLRDKISGELEGYNPEKNYYAGIDLAKYQDFTVIIIIDNNKHLCFFDRFNRIDWGIQKQRILKILNDYKAQAFIDSTGVGDPIYEELKGGYSEIYGFKFTNESKQNLIVALQVAFEKEEITFPKIECLIDELEAFEYEMLPSGRVRYNAPQGYFDDCVISLALANWCKMKVMASSSSISDLSFR